MDQYVLMKVIKENFFLNLVSGKLLEIYVCYFSFYFEISTLINGERKSIFLENKIEHIFLIKTYCVIIVIITVIFKSLIDIETLFANICNLFRFI